MLSSFSISRYNHYMEKLLIAFFFLSCSNFDSEKEKECKLALNAEFHLQSRDSIMMSADSLYDDLENHFGRNNDKDVVLRHLLKRERAAVSKCLSTAGKNEECAKEEDLYANAFYKLKADARDKGMVDIKVCNHDDFADLLESKSISHLNKLGNCIKSDSHREFIAKEYGISKKHIKHKKEIEAEIKDRYEIKSEHKLCSPVPIVAKLNIYKEMNKKHKCEKLLEKSNLIQKLKEKCSK
jgi:hypothetical protein